MSERDRQKWNQRYAAGYYRDRLHPSALLADFVTRLPRGRALDVGCGAGRNALFLAAAGYEVDAIDISQVALERARNSEQAAQVNWIEADLETESLDALLQDRRYALIVMVRYVNATLMNALRDRLSDGGHLLAEQHLETSQAVVGPKSPAFRVRANELLRAAGGLRVLYYREGLVRDPDERVAALAQLVACRGAPYFEASSQLPG